MPLKECKECKNEVSTKATKCPHCGIKNPTVTTKQQIIAGIILILVFGFILSRCSDDSVSQNYKDNENKILGEIKEFSSENKRQIVKSFLFQNNIATFYVDEFYKCMSHFSHTKLESLKLNTIMGWCKGEFDNNDEKFINKYYDLDKVKSQFSTWNGSHHNLTMLVKNAMHDSDSYEHIETRYSLILSDNDPHIFLISQFKGTNVFGAIVKQSISAKANIETGDIIQVIE